MHTINKRAYVLILTLKEGVFKCVLVLGLVWEVTMDIVMQCQAIPGRLSNTDTTWNDWNAHNKELTAFSRKGCS